MLRSLSWCSYHGQASRMKRGSSTPVIDGPGRREAAGGATGNPLGCDVNHCRAYGAMRAFCRARSNALGGGGGHEVHASADRQRHVLARDHSVCGDGFHYNDSCMHHRCWHRLGWLVRRSGRCVYIALCSVRVPVTVPNPLRPHASPPVLWGF
jgi:hypothetical protein